MNTKNTTLQSKAKKEEPNLKLELAAMKFWGGLDVEGELQEWSRNYDCKIDFKSLTAEQKINLFLSIKKLSKLFYIIELGIPIAIILIVARIIHQQNIIFISKLITFQLNEQLSTGIEAAIFLSISFYLIYKFSKKQTDRYICKKIKAEYNKIKDEIK